MPDLAGMLVRRSMRGLGSSTEECHACHRIPLAGERVHELGSGRQLCDLCFGALPEESRQAVRSERVGVSERRLAVVPKAA